MSADPLSPFTQVWLVDFEFHQPGGERPDPLCMVAREHRTGETLQIWRDDLLVLDGSPMPVGPDTLFVAYYASAELGCYLSLGWRLPVRILDLCIEFKCRTSGLPTACGHGLLGALSHFGLDGIDAVDKGTMRELAMRGGDYTRAERTALLDYCQSDVDALEKLLPAMLPSIDVPWALLRGRYMAAVAHMEHVGSPIDKALLGRLRESWEPLKRRLVHEVDRDFGVFVPAGCNRAAQLVGDAQSVNDPDVPLSFSQAKFAEYLVLNDMPWPRLFSGALALDNDTFRQMAKVYPKISPLRKLRHSLSAMRLEELAVGKGGRNRCMLSAFASRTGRNQPSNTRFIFGPSVWLRGLIRPASGYALAYIDWSQQEFGIAAALSGDRTMMGAYTSGDPYLAFARQAGAVPADATKETHGDIREQFKVCALAVQYGMAEKSLAERLGVCEARGRELLQLHRETYPTFWKWSQAAVDYAMLRGELHTVFG